jgi:hypothetical protein
MMHLSQSDIEQIAKLGINNEQIQKQIETFKKGFPFLEIIRPATVGDGIIRLSNKDLNKKIKLYNKNHHYKKIIKFVPASGAASRMFKNLFEFISSDNPSKMLEDKGIDSISTFFSNIQKFAFFQDLIKCAELKNIDFKSELSLDDKLLIVKTLISEKGLNYGNLPKGLLKFHQYDNFSKTPIQEHLMEAALYASSQNNAQLHFTVSPEHLRLFQDHVNESVHELEDLFEIKCDVGFSVQKSSTDTIAVDVKNNVFRNSDGSLLFRPGGHGALIENLNELDADIIFIKNIDNVVPDRLKSETVEYKKALAGLLIEYQDLIFANIKKLVIVSQPDLDELFEVENFVFKNLCIEQGENYNTLPHKNKVKFLFDKLNRPIRICGMVKNSGEPGGGPFWALNTDKTVSLQIVESSQIDMNNATKRELVGKSTHFNPVDLICAVKDYQGRKFDLLKYIDENTGFISEKSKDGKTLKALELPGLWNGAMSNWITIFVEVPLITFNPVKTINDLLRTEHQAIE